MMSVGMLLKSFGFCKDLLAEFSQIPLALLRAQSIGCEAMQVFVYYPAGAMAPVMGDIERFITRRCRSYGIGGVRVSVIYPPCPLRTFRYFLSYSRRCRERGDCPEKKDF